MTHHQHSTDTTYDGFDTECAACQADIAQTYGHLGYANDINPIIPKVRQQIIDGTGKDIGDRRTRDLIDSIRVSIAVELVQPLRVR